LNKPNTPREGENWQKSTEYTQDGSQNPTAMMQRIQCGRRRSSMDRTLPS
jgi:hypothetical protein